MCSRASKCVGWHPWNEHAEKTRHWRPPCNVYTCFGASSPECSRVCDAYKSSHRCIRRLGHVCCVGFGFLLRRLTNQVTQNKWTPFCKAHKVFGFSLNVLFGWRTRAESRPPLERNLRMKQKWGRLLIYWCILTRTVWRWWRSNWWWGNLVWWRKQPTFVRDEGLLVCAISAWQLPTTTRLA